jgi:hypothetical protein
MNDRTVSRSAKLTLGKETLKMLSPIRTGIRTGRINDAKPGSLAPCPDTKTATPSECWACVTPGCVHTG